MTRRSKTLILLLSSACLVAAVAIAVTATGEGEQPSVPPSPQEDEQPSVPQEEEQSPSLRGLKSDSGPTSSCTEKDPCKFQMITDLDGGSKDGSEWKAYLMPGKLYQDKGKYKVKVDKEEKIAGKYNDGGKGMELSELIHFDGMLLAFDDKTGIVYEISDKQAWPREIFSEGDGDDDDGMKIEWATIKDGKLWFGSHGDDKDQRWVVILDNNGGKRRENWDKLYTKIRSKLDADEVDHEAVLWSTRSKKWIFCPRRVEKKGSSKSDNSMVICNDGCSSIDVKKVGKQKSGVGFSAIRFVPGTQEKVIMAVKSYEKGSSQKSYLTVFTVDGDILMDDVQISSSHKYEGLVFDDDGHAHDDGHHSPNDEKSEDEKEDDDKDDDKDDEKDCRSRH